MEMVLALFALCCQVMPSTRICPDCERRLTEASQAMRRHATDMSKAIQLVRNGGGSEEQRQELTARLLASFDDAQSAWDTYREHLIEHGLLLPAPKLSAQ